MNEEFFVDVTALRQQMDIVRAKQYTIREIIDLLGTSRNRLPPELYYQSRKAMEYAEGLLHYFREQEDMLQEMSDSYDATNRIVGDMLEEATAQAEYLF